MVIESTPHKDNALALSLSLSLSLVHALTHKHKTYFTNHTTHTQTMIIESQKYWKVVNTFSRILIGDNISLSGNKTRSATRETCYVKSHLL